MSVTFLDFIRKVAKEKRNRGFIIKGGKGSGHHGHAGRPGEIGGSLPGEAQDILTLKMSKRERAEAIRNLTISQYFALLRTGLPKPRNPKYASYERGLFRTRAAELHRQAQKDANARQIWNEEANKLGDERGQRMKIS